jgi:hypothetical protein
LKKPFQNSEKQLIDENNYGLLQKVQKMREDYVTFFLPCGTIMGFESRSRYKLKRLTTFLKIEK